MCRHVPKVPYGIYAPVSQYPMVIGYWWMVIGVHCTNTIHFSRLSTI